MHPEQHLYLRGFAGAESQQGEETLAFVLVEDQFAASLELLEAPHRQCSLQSSQHSRTLLGDAHSQAVHCCSVHIGFCVHEAAELDEELLVDSRQIVL